MKAKSAYFTHLLEQMCSLTAQPITLILPMNSQEKPLLLSPPNIVSISLPSLRAKLWLFL